MKLKNELNGIIEAFESIKDRIVAHAKYLKEVGGYNDFETRLAWDALRAVRTSQWICELYDKYDCNVEHIDTLARKALQAVYKI